jgi:hypothetical protein
VITIPDLGDHEDPISAFTITALGVHDGREGVDPPLALVSLARSVRDPGRALLPGSTGGFPG